MHETTIAQALENRQRGGFFTLYVDRPANTRKGVTQDIRKQSVLQGQLCDYANKKIVREAVEDGIRDTPVLPSYVKEQFVLQNVSFWRGNNGQVYLPVPLVGNKPQVTWIMDGVEVAKEDIAPLLLASELRESQPNEEAGQVAFVGIKVENIVEVR